VRARNGCADIYSWFNEGVGRSPPKIKGAGYVQRTIAGGCVLQCLRVLPPQRT